VDWRMVLAGANAEADPTRETMETAWRNFIMTVSANRVEQ
jgi:hypothetical protein